MPDIRTENLRKEYPGITAVEGLNLTVERGELFALLGVNGAGKTTTIKMLSCLTRPTGGDALLNGSSILRDRERVKSIIAVSPQETAVAPGLTVRENLELVGEGFRKIAYALPFVHAVELERGVLAGDFTGSLPHVWWVLGYAALTLTAAVALFLRQMRRQ